jgi:CRP-like cAMP-binding protein
MSIYGIPEADALVSWFQSGIKKVFPRNSTIFSQGGEDGLLCLILSGRVKLVARDKTGFAAWTDILKTGDIIGLESLVCQPHIATAHALCDVVVAFKGVDQFT